MDIAAKPANPPTYLIDNHANLIIEQGGTRVVINAAAALELIAFIDRTGHLASAKKISQGADK
jgi:hypothetical protein